MQEEIFKKIIDERSRQFNLPGTEFDVANLPNDWCSIVGHYIFDEIRRGSNKPSREDYENNLIKAAAIILAALEHCPLMETKGFFK